MSPVLFLTAGELGRKILDSASASARPFSPGSLAPTLADVVCPAGGWDLGCRSLVFPGTCRPKHHVACGEPPSFSDNLSATVTSVAHSVTAVVGRSRAKAKRASSDVPLALGPRPAGRTRTERRHPGPEAASRPPRRSRELLSSNPGLELDGRRHRTIGSSLHFRPLPPHPRVMKPKAGKCHQPKEREQSVCGRGRPGRGCSTGGPSTGPGRAQPPS